MRRGVNATEALLAVFRQPLTAAEACDWPGPCPACEGHGRLENAKVVGLKPVCMRCDGDGWARP